MKSLPEIEISEELDARITEGMAISERGQAEVVREALEIGLPQLAARFKTPPPMWLEERIREALSEPGVTMTWEEFEKSMDEIADGR